MPREGHLISAAPPTAGVRSEDLQLHGHGARMSAQRAREGPLGWLPAGGSMPAASVAAGMGPPVSYPPDGGVLVEGPWDEEQVMPSLPELEAASAPVLLPTHEGAWLRSWRNG